MRGRWRGFPAVATPRRLFQNGSAEASVGFVRQQHVGDLARFGRQSTDLLLTRRNIVNWM
jgi:hypothetical protein